MGPVTLCLVAVAIFAMNIAFGYWRAAVPRFSRQWLAAIHLPVPAVITLRFATGLGWVWTTYPVLVGAFFLGQLTGARSEGSSTGASAVWTCQVAWCGIWCAGTASDIRHRNRAAAITEKFRRFRCERCLPGLCLRDNEGEPLPLAPQCWLVLWGLTSMVTVPKAYALYFA